MKNIHETTEALDFLFDLSDAIVGSLEDGKITILDAPKFLKPARSAGSGIGGIENIPKELDKITDEDWSSLAAHVAERFDIKNDQLETKIEEILKRTGLLAISIKELYALKKAS